MPPATRAQHAVSLEIQDPTGGGWINMGRWAVLEGAGVTAESETYQDWDGPLKLGGSREREDATIRRAYGRHAQEIFRQLDAWTGDAQIRLTRIQTTSAGAVVEGAERITYTGVLTGANLGNVEKGSSEATEIELVCALNPSLA